MEGYGRHGNKGIDNVLKYNTKAIMKSTIYQYFMAGSPSGMPHFARWPKIDRQRVVPDREDLLHYEALYVNI